ncbi:MAG: FAD-dependent oxidoreductase [Ornithinimicrobium sp.]
MTIPHHLPTIVIGAGPIGLAAAAELLQRGQDVVVLESGSVPAAAVRSWGHVRLFSPWSEVIAPAAEQLLSRSGWRSPAHDSYPTGHEWADLYLDPLAEALGDRVRCGHRVLGVAKRDRDLVVDDAREDQPFVVAVAESSGPAGAIGRSYRLEASAVVDASGTTGMPNPLAADGYPAAGEVALGRHLHYGTPDPRATPDRYAARAVAVVGSGASALTSLIALTSSTLREGGHAPSRVVWVVRRGEVGGAFGGGSADELPQRGALGTAVHRAVGQGRIEVVTGFRTAAVQRSGHGLALASSDGRTIDGLDEVIVATGYRPDLSFLSEARLDLDPRLQAPRRLAPSIDPNQHSCGSVAPHGYDVLQQGDPGLFLAGMKSYGRASSFLAMVGFEQVRSIAAAIDGDLASAAAVELTLPDTGVCGGAGLFDPAPEVDEPPLAQGCCSA